MSQSNENEKAARPKLLRQAGLVGLGSTLTVGMVGFTLLGFYVGGRFERVAAGILVGMTLGLLFCGYEVWKIVRESERASDETGKGA